MYDLFISFFNGFTPDYNIQTLLYFVFTFIVLGLFFRLLYILFRGV